MTDTYTALAHALPLTPQLWLMHCHSLQSSVSKRGVLMMTAKSRIDNKREEHSDMQTSNCGRRLRVCEAADEAESRISFDRSNI